MANAFFKSVAKLGVYRNEGSRIDLIRPRLSWRDPRHHRTQSDGSIATGESIAARGKSVGAPAHRAATLPKRACKKRQACSLDHSFTPKDPKRPSAGFRTVHRAIGAFDQRLRILPVAAKELLRAIDVGSDVLCFTSLPCNLLCSMAHELLATCTVIFDSASSMGQPSERIRRVTEESLKRLKTDRIDLFSAAIGWIKVNNPHDLLSGFQQWTGREKPV